MTRDNPKRGSAESTPMADKVEVTRPEGLCNYRQRIPRAESL